MMQDRGEDRGVDPSGFETVLAATKGSGLQALHLPVDVKVRQAGSSTTTTTYQQAPSKQASQPAA